MSPAIHLKPLHHVYFDAAFWSPFFQRFFAKQIRDFSIVFESRVLPVFANADEEANAAADAEYDRMGSLPGSEDSFYDMSDAAEDAFEAGLAHYEMLRSVEQSFLNLATAALHHLFEQQQLAFHRRQVLRTFEERDPKLNSKLAVFYERLRAGGVEVEAIASWSTIRELRAVSNTIKHGEGRSARELRELNPRLFTPPALHGTLLDRPAGIVDFPLGGDDIFVTLADFQRYSAALVEFWSDFGDAIQDSQDRDRSV